MKENELEITAYCNAGYAFTHCLIGKEFDCISGSDFLDQADVTMKGGWVNFDLLFVELSFSAAGRIHTRTAVPSWEYGGKEAREYWDETFFHLLNVCPRVLSQRLMTMMERFTEELMCRQWSIVTRIAEKLLTQETLTYGQARDIVLDFALTSEPDQAPEPEQAALRDLMDENLAEPIARDGLWESGPVEAFRKLGDLLGPYSE